MLKQIWQKWSESDETWPNVRQIRPSQKASFFLNTYMGGGQHFGKFVILQAALQELFFRQTPVIVLIHPEMKTFLSPLQIKSV